MGSNTDSSDKDDDSSISDLSSRTESDAGNRNNKKLANKKKHKANKRGKDDGCRKKKKKIDMNAEAPREDLCLTKTHVSVSDDAVVGKNQKGPQFWLRDVSDLSPDDSDAASATNKVAGTMQGANLERPPGSKAAKLRRKEDGEATRDSAAANRAIIDLNRAIIDIAETIKKKFAWSQFRQLRHQKMEYAKMCLALGKNQMAEKALNEYALMQPPADESSEGHPKEVTVNADEIHEGSTGTTVNENNDTATDVPINTDRIDGGMDGVGDSLV